MAARSLPRRIQRTGPNVDEDGDASRTTNARWRRYEVVKGITTWSPGFKSASSAAISRAPVGNV